MIYVHEYASHAVYDLQIHAYVSKREFNHDESTDIDGHRTHLLRAGAPQASSSQP